MYICVHSLCVALLSPTRCVGVHLPGFCSLVRPRSCLASQQFPLALRPTHLLAVHHRSHQSSLFLEPLVSDCRSLRPRILCCWPSLSKLRATTSQLDTQHVNKNSDCPITAPYKPIRSARVSSLTTRRKRSKYKVASKWSHG